MWRLIGLILLYLRKRGSVGVHWFDTVVLSREGKRLPLIGLIL